MISKPDKRRFPRVKIAPEAPEVQMHLANVGGGTDSRRVRATDLSRSGMSFHSAGLLEEGTRCTILINHRQRPMRIIGRVVNAHRAEQGGYIVGVRFTSITPISAEGLSTPICDDPTVDRLLVDND
jgi:hypothetical protein